MNTMEDVIKKTLEKTQSGAMNWKGVAVLPNGQPSAWIHDGEATDGVSFQFWIGEERVGEGKTAAYIWLRIGARLFSVGGCLAEELLNTICETQHVDRYIPESEALAPVMDYLEGLSPEESL